MEPSARLQQEDKPPASGITDAERIAAPEAEVIRLRAEERYARDAATLRTFDQMLEDRRRLPAGLRPRPSGPCHLELIR